MIWISGSIIALILGIIVAALAYGKYADWQAKRCKHAARKEYVIDGILYRGCPDCDQVEKFDPDVSGNTAGHWDRVT